MSEVFKSVIGLEGYFEVSNKGVVRGLDRVIPHKQYGSAKIKGRVFKPTFNNSGYQTVTLWGNGKKLSALVHRLVYEAFSARIEKGQNINHINGNKKDNRIENLECVTHSENQKHAYQKGLNRSKKRMIISIKNGVEVFHESILSASKTLGVERRNIYASIDNPKRTIKGYFFKTIYPREYSEFNNKQKKVA